MLFFWIQIIIVLVIIFSRYWSKSIIRIPLPPISPMGLCPIGFQGGLGALPPVPSLNERQHKWSTWSMRSYETRVMKNKPLARRAKRLILKHSCRIDSKCVKCTTLLPRNSTNVRNATLITWPWNSVRQVKLINHCQMGPTAQLFSWYARLFCSARTLRPSAFRPTWSN